MHKVTEVWIHLWSWLPWIVAMIAAIVSFISNLIGIIEKVHKIRRWYHRRRARKLLESNREFVEVELPSEL